MSQLWRIPDWFPYINEEAMGRLKFYLDDLTKWTKKVNLISPGTIDEADRVHFADSIMGIELFGRDLIAGSEIYDLGSGNGIPGVVLSILRPDLSLCCLDSDERKIGFIKQLGLRLDLKNLRTQCMRLEKVRVDEISLATARGFAPLKKALDIAAPHFKAGGSIYHFKGQEFQLELDEIPEKIREIWKTVVVGEYSLPLCGGDRVILKSTIRLPPPLPIFS